MAKKVKLNTNSNKKYNFKNNENSNDVKKSKIINKKKKSKINSKPDTNQQLKKILLEKLIDKIK
jgi:hypothetical protein